MRIVLLCITVLLAQLAAAQAPRFKKYSVSDSGVDVYLPAAPGPATMAYSPDSSKVYTIEAVDTIGRKYYHFGALVINMQVSCTGMEDTLMTQYLDYLKTNFDVISSAGYGYGHTLSTHPTAKGIIDYWGDRDRDEWKVSAWAAEYYLVVLFEYGPEEYPNTNVLDIFGKGVRFPGD